MTVAFSVKMEDEHSLQFSQRVRNEIFRATYQAIGSRWRDKWLPRHFTRRARQIYGYRPRSMKWMRRKQREAKLGSKVKKGGRVDLVYTGLAEQLFARPHVIRAFPTRATINMHGPRYISMRPQKGNVNALGPEVLKWTAEELRDLDEVGQVAMEQLIKAAPPRRKTFKGR